MHEYPKVWLYQWQEDGSWREEPRTVYDDTWHAHCIFVTAELMYRRFDARMVMAMAAAHQLSMLDASMDGRDVVTNWIGEGRVAHFLEAAAVLAQVDPVDYGLLERKGGRLVTGPLPGEQWVTHLADMNWPYTMGAAHNYTWPLLRQLAGERLRAAGRRSAPDQPVQELRLVAARADHAVRDLGPRGLRCRARDDTAPGHAMSSNIPTDP